MIVRDRSFPHPVMSPFRDDVMPNQFEMSVSVSSDADSHYLQVGLTYGNATLTELVEAGKATHAIHIECRRNFYRDLVRSASRSPRITLRAADLVGRVEVSGFILASTCLENYRIAGAHADYGAAGFTIDPGDVLAVSQSLQFDAFVDYDPLSSIASILMIEKSAIEDEGPVLVSTDGDRIVATLSMQDYDRYTNLKGDPTLAPLLANQLVVPVLVESLGRMKAASEEEHEEDMELRWYRSVARKLVENGKDIRSPSVTALDAAQLLLSLPMRRSLSDLLRITEKDGEA